MKNNILNRFAFSDLKKHKQDACIISITIFLVSIIVMLIMLSSPLLLHGDYFKNIIQNGSYNYSTSYFRYNENNRVDYLKSEAYVVGNDVLTLDDISHCWVYDYGKTLNHENMVAIEGDSSIIATHLKKGNMPLKDHEIALKQSVLDNWGYHADINDEIELSFVSYEDSSLSYTYVDESYDFKHFYDKDYKVETFKVVGILEETGNSSIIVSCKVDSLFQLYLKTEYDTNIQMNKVINNGNELHLDHVNSMNNYTGTMDEAIILVFIQVIIVVVAVTLIYGLTVSSFEKKQKDLTLLRSIGVTQKQMYYILFVQTIVISLLPIIISIAIAYFVSLALPQLLHINYQLKFDIFTMLWGACIVYCIVYGSYVVPALGVTKRSLSGSFDGYEFQHFYYQYKKHHFLNAFYLAWRSLVGLKKKMIVKVFLVALISISSVSVLRDIAMYTYDKLTNENQIMFTYSYMLNKDEFEDINLNIIKEDISHINDFSLIDVYENNMYGDNDENDISPYCSFIYRYDKQTKDYYNLIDLNPDEMIITSTYLDDLPQKYNVNDTVIFFGKEYKIAQIIDYPRDEVILHRDNYHKLNATESKELIFQFQSIEERRNALLNNNAFMKFKSHHVDSYVNASNELTLNSKSIIYHLCMISVLTMIYVCQYGYETIKQKEDIGSYQLLGMTGKELSKIYFYKSFIIALFGMLVGCIYDGLVWYYNHALKTITIDVIIVSFAVPYVITILMIAFISIMSLIPLIHIVKHNAFENKLTRD